MKKTTYNVTVAFLPVTEGEIPTPQTVELTGANAEAAVAQARAGQDIRYTLEGTEYLIEWSSVRYVIINKVIEDATAPTDTICGGSDDNALVVTLGDPVKALIAGIAPNCTIRVDPINNIAAVTLNGEPVNIHDFMENATYTVVGGTENGGYWNIPVACGTPADTLVPYTAIFTYQGHTASANGNVKVDGGFG